MMIIRQKVRVWRFVDVRGGSSVCFFFSLCCVVRKITFVVSNIITKGRH